ncbi:MAG: hypothetical protein JWP81_610 [Ferruginibacter sp.]|nr:hypothetical protein [Ferruginibacter sp.]
MTKKYLPFIVLLAAGLLLFYIKKNQRGNAPVRHSPDITIPVVTNEEFNRKPHTIIYSKHARCRMDCRHIDESEVLEVLQNGQLNYEKIGQNEKGKTFPLEGITRDRQNVRIVFAPKEDDLVVVTVIDLDRDWDCNCKDP